MSNDERVNALRKILKPIIDWYTKIEEEGEPDSSYLYDTTCDRFNDLSRGDLQQIIEILK